ncbi:hypothetical protein EJB05_24628, partial [Eragrostis curvula]
MEGGSGSAPLAPDDITAAAASSHARPEGPQPNVSKSLGSAAGPQGHAAQSATASEYGAYLLGVAEYTCSNGRPGPARHGPELNGPARPDSYMGRVLCRAGPFGPKARGGPRSTTPAHETHEDQIWPEREEVTGGAVRGRRGRKRAMPRRGGGERERTPASGGRRQAALRRGEEAGGTGQEEREEASVGTREG